METYREKKAIQAFAIKQRKQAEKKVGPQLVGSVKQVTWAHGIRHKWLAWSVAKGYRVKELLHLLPQNQLEAAISLLAKDATAAEWINLAQEHGSLKSYLMGKLDSDSRFVFNLMFEEQLNTVRATISTCPEAAYLEQAPSPPKGAPCW